ncbi:MAG: endo-1,4-beta-xylanase [Ignavibacteria bacterium]|jgi:endo-1,4-beta-xylanase
MEDKILRLRRNFIYFFILILTLAVTNTNAQLVTNGGFEDTEPGAVTDSLTGIDGWLLQLMDGAVADFQVVADTAQEGNHSLRLVADTLGTNQWSIQAIADSIPVVPGNTYNYSVWAKAETAGAQVNFTVGNYSYNEYNVIRPATLTTEWQKFTMEFTVTDDQTVIRAPIHFNYSSNVDNAIYIDNLVINNVADALKPVIVEAESGDVGSDYSILQEDGTEYVSIQTNSTAFYPGSSARIISYEVTFADTGTYDLFIRLRVGSGEYDDDSFFYGNGFGEKDSTNDADWIFINGVASGGFSDSSEVVLEAGGLGSEVWKWVNLSHNAYQGDTTLTFTIVEVEAGLTQTFQIGAREDGLDIDKIAFGKSYLYYTVGNLDNGEAGSTELPGEVWEGPPLASNQSKFVGNIYSSSQEENFESYWNQVTPENAGKWGSVEATRDNMNWSGLDAAYNLAKDNDFPFNFHVLIWGSQQPSWIDDLSSEEQLEEIKEWFEAVAEKYPDIEYLQVVNEPLAGHSPPNYKEALGGDGETGWDWVLTAFRMAREIFPSETKLMINDYNIISSLSSTSQYLNIIRLLQAENLIDVIGEQGHAFTTTAAVATMERNLDSLASTGLPIQITELDIDGLSDDVQLESYQRIFPPLYEHPGVEGITLWGWRRGLWRDEQGAYLINQNGSERSALEWLRDYLDTLNLEPVTDVDDIAEIPNEYSLSNNYPNPFNPSTIIEFALPKKSEVKITVYNILGKRVALLTDKSYNAGIHKINFDASTLTSGVYFYRIEAGEFSQVKKMILIK